MIEKVLRKLIILFNVCCPEKSEYQLLFRVAELLLKSAVPTVCGFLHTVSLAPSEAFCLPFASCVFTVRLFIAALVNNMNPSCKS